MNEYCFFDYVIQVDKMIGSGQFGIVVECYHKTKYKNVDLCAKIVQNKTKIDESMMKEIQILKKIKSINNSHLIIVYDMFESENKFFIIMERCKGGELKHLIDSKINLPQQFKASEIIDFVFQFLDGYKILYDNKIMHRDIKPQNVFIGSNQQYKIGDLGAGRILEDVKKKGDYTKIGSPIYSSPQILQLQQFSSQTDVYSFGMVIYQLTFLKFPFKPVFSELMNFIKKISQEKFKLPDQSILNEGTQREKDEIQFLIENMLVYEENQRISWEQLFERVKSGVVYEQFRSKYEQPQVEQLQKSINFEEKIKKKQAKEAQLQEAIRLFQKQLNNKDNSSIPNTKQENQISSLTNQEKKRSPLSQYLRIQHSKVIMIDRALQYLGEVVYQNLIPIQYMDYLLLLSSMYGYQYNLLKNIQAINKGDYNQLSEHIREQKDKEAENYRVINEFQQFMTADDIKIFEQSSKLLQNINNTINQAFKATIELINQQKIRFQTLCDLREILQKFNQYNNYYRYWEFVRKFFNQYLQKFFNEILQSDFTNYEDQILFFMVYIYEVYTLEEKYKQLELFKENKIMIIPKQEYDRQDAINYIQNKRKEYQSQQINHNQFY